MGSWFLVYSPIPYPGGWRFNWDRFTLNIFCHRINCLVNKKSRQDKRVLECFHQASLYVSHSYLLSPFPKIDELLVLNFGWLLSRSKDNRKTLIDTTKRRPRTLDRCGSRLFAVFY